MKYRWVFICCVFLFLFGCASKDREAADSMTASRTSTHYDGRLRIVMHFCSEGTLASLNITDYYYGMFQLIALSRYDFKLHSFLMSSASSAYLITSNFNTDHRLQRFERVCDLVIFKEIFNDGRVEISTSFVEGVYSTTPLPYSEQRERILPMLIPLHSCRGDT